MIFRKTTLLALNYRPKPNDQIIFDEQTTNYVKIRQANSVRLWDRFNRGSPLPMQPSKTTQL